MSRFRIIDGSNVTSIAERDGEIKKLEFEIQKKVDPTDKDLVVYAYHFVRLGNFLLAQKYLNRLHEHYFDNGVYKDLSHSLLVWSLMNATGGSMSDQARATYEYYVILKRAIEMFEEVNFVSKPAFYRFKKTIHEFTKTFVST